MYPLRDIKTRHEEALDMNIRQRFGSVEVMHRRGTSEWCLIAGAAIYTFGINYKVSKYKNKAIELQKHNNSLKVAAKRE